MDSKLGSLPGGRSGRAESLLGDKPGHESKLAKGNRRARFSVLFWDLFVTGELLVKSPDEL